MVIIAERTRHPFESAPLRAMFRARKRVFVDLLGWDVPVIDGRFEIDQFDDEHAVYLIVTLPDGRHAGSARLLRTTRPHILDTLFPGLCAAPPPRPPPGRALAPRRDLPDLGITRLGELARLPGASVADRLGAVGRAP
jgi:N-acyl-L-homoserine lactone synthetase